MWVRKKKEVHMRARAQTEIVVNEHKAACPECGHPEYGDTDLDALRKLESHVQTCHPERFAAAQSNVIPLKKRD